MRVLSLLVLLAVGAVPAKLALGLPLDRETVDLVKMVDAGRPQGKVHLLTDANLAHVIRASESDNVPLRAAAAYALAFTDSDAGVSALRALQSDKFELVAGVAEFSILRRETLPLKREELLGVFSFRLGSSARPFARVMLANWLGEEFKASSVPLLLAALQKEGHRFVRAEMAFQIASHGDLAQLKAAQLLLEQDSRAVAFHDEALTQFLDQVSRSPTKRPLVPLRLFIESRMRAISATPRNE